MVITIDGPAGSGKSTVARLLAARLGIHYLDTGAMYRAATLKAMRQGVDWSDQAALARLVRESHIEFQDRPEDGVPGSVRVLIDGQDVTELIRAPELTACIHHLADAPAVRQEMNAHQQNWAEGRDLVADGRDLGTVVFPQADRKFYLDASPETRVRRRSLEMEARGIRRDEVELAQELRQRDDRDRKRAVAPLRCPEDAIRIDTTHHTIEEVVTLLATWVRVR